jgi:hypothetical protein
MPNLSEQTLSALDEVYGPVVLNFTIKQTPVSGAPDHIKEQWVGIALPVRKENIARLTTRYLDLLTGEFQENEGPVPVPGLEAVHALEEAGKAEAAQYWLPVRLGLFIFRAYEGDFSAVTES